MMAFAYRTFPDCPPGKDPVKHWNEFVDFHNKDAEHFNKSWLNRLFGIKIPLAKKITNDGSNKI